MRRYRRRMIGTGCWALFTSGHTQCNAQLFEASSMVKYEAGLLLPSRLETSQADNLALWSSFYAALAAYPAPMSSSSTSTSVPCASMFCPDFKIISLFFPGRCVCHTQGALQVARCSVLLVIIIFYVINVVFVLHQILVMIVGSTDWRAPLS